MKLSAKGWIAVSLAVVIGLVVIVEAAILAERRAQKAAGKVVAIDAARRGEVIRAETNQAVAIRGAQAADVQIRVERTTQTIIREIEARPDASTPVPPDLARAWVAGLERVCDAAGADACARGPDRAHAGAGNEPVPARVDPGP